MIPANSSPPLMSDDPERSGKSAHRSTRRPRAGLLRVLRWVGLDARAGPDGPEGAAFRAARDRLAKVETPRALTQIALLVIALSFINFVLQPAWHPMFHVLDLAAAMVALGAGAWLRHTGSPPRAAPWVFSSCMVLLAYALLFQTWLAPVSGPGFVLIVISVTGPLTLAWRPFAIAAAAMTLGTAAAAWSSPGEMVDWAFHAGTAALASAVLLQLRLQSIRDEVRAATVLAAVHDSLIEAQRIAHLGSWDLDLSNNAVVGSDEMAQMMGRPTGDPVSRDGLERLFTPESWRRLRRAVSGTRVSGEPFELEVQTISGDGAKNWLLIRGEPTLDGRGAVRGIHGTALDITERKTAQLDLAASEELLRVVLDTSQDTTMRFGTDGRVDYVNRRGPQISGIAATQSIGRTLAEMGYPEALAATWEAHRQRVFDTGRPVTFEYDLETAGARSWYEASMAPEFGPGGRVTHVVSTSRDVTARKLAEQELLRLANRDVLTGLANRAALLDEIPRALSAGRRLGLTTGLLMLDLDRFKGVNDTLGHAAGDELLIAAAARIAGLVRAGDLVARLGGDEFVVVMRDLHHPSEAVQAAHRLVTAFRDSFNPGGAELFATASIGIAIASPSSDASDLIRESDTALYAAKENGRDRIEIYNEDLRLAASTRMAVENDLRRALERGELEVWYQPEVDLETSSVIAVEALLRWHHPDGQVWVADRFIEVAESTGLILDIGDWVLRQACAEAAAWSGSSRRPVTVRVNVSALQLAEAGLLEAIDAALDLSGLDPNLLCVEITETALLRETTTARDNLDGMHERGIGIAIDDFGTGYASLAYLHRYPTDVLKIDRSFIRDLTTDSHDHRLVAGIIALANQVRVAVTAEGVERPDQAAILHDMGCPSAQGWLFSKALPVELIRPLLEASRPFAFTMPSTSTKSARTTDDTPSL